MEELPKPPEFIVLDDTEKNNVVEKPLIKEGVDFIFEKFPELASIGNKEQYSQYLDSVFPSSTIKDILYHGLPTIENRDDYFRDGKDGDDIRSWDFFYKNRERALNVGQEVYVVIVDSNVDFNSPEIIYKSGPTYKTENSAIVIEQGGDEFVFKNKRQIHILGSEKDLVSFKGFVEKLKI
ncbi:MAG: hypothetical protein WC827_00580 [Candidatus Paceibacterota bacterium]|jgi:hypothetical protein